MTAATSAQPAVPRVAAIVVTHSVTRFLEPALRSLADQQRLPDEVIIVDWARSGQAVDELAAETLGTMVPFRVHRAPGAANMGVAIRSALRALPVEANWLWLWHDDMVARPDALEHLMRAVERSDSLAIAGVKQRLPGNLGVLAEAGFTTSRFGKRYTGVQPGDLDQGQLDHRVDTLAVGTAGMLIDASVWAELGGPDPVLGPFGDGLDLCRRARLAGHRVVVVPDAIIEHSQARFRGTRSSRRSKDDPAASMGERRRAQIYLAHVVAPALLIPFLSIGYLAAAIVRALWRLAQEDLGAAWAEVAAVVWVLAHPGALVRARRRTAATSKFGHSALRPLEVSRRQIRAARKDRKAAQAEERRVREAPSEVEIAEKAALALRRRWVLALLVGILIVLDAAVFWRYAFQGALWGGALLPADTSLGGLWSAATSPWIDAGLGAPGPSDPLLAVMLVPSLLCLGNVQLAVMLSFFLAPVLAGITAWFAAGAGTRHLAVRFLAGLAWAGCPTLWVAIAQGRLGAALAHVFVPLVVLGAVRAMGLDRRDVIAPAGGVAARPAPSRGPGSLGAAAAGGLAAAVAAAGAPILLPAVVIAALGCMVLAPRGKRLRLALVGVTPLLLFAIPIGAALRSWSVGGWRGLLGDPGLPSAAKPAAMWQQVLGWPTEPVGPTWLPSQLFLWLALGVGAALVLWAVAATASSGCQWRACLAGWCLTAVGVATGVVSSRIAVAADATQLVTPWTGASISLVVAGLLTSAVVGGERLVRRCDRPKPALARPVGVAMLVIAGACLVVNASSAVLVFGANSELQTRAHTVVPAIALEGQDSAESSRTLLLSAAASGTMSWQVARANGPQFTDTAAAVSARAVSGPALNGTPAGADYATRFLDSVTARLAAGNGYDPSADLAAAAIAFVVVPPALEGSDDSDARSTLVATLNSTPGLSWVATVDAGDVWRVSFAGPDDPGRPARVHLVGPDGGDLGVLIAKGASSFTVSVPAGVQGRVLQVAERADNGWHASLAGQPLPAVSGTWYQAFELPTRGGQVTVTFDYGWVRPVTVVAAALLLVMVLLALPIRPRRAQERDR